MKRAYKYELADAAGVSYATFYRWLNSKQRELAGLGVKPSAKMLPPKAVEWVCREYGIDFGRALQTLQTLHGKKRHKHLLIYIYNKITNNTLNNISIINATAFVSKKHVTFVTFVTFFCNFTPENIVSFTSTMQRNSHNALSHKVLPSYPCHPVCNKR